MAAPERAAVPVKVRVGEVSTAAYAAVFGRLGLALELGWLPLLIMLAVDLVPGVVESFAPPPADVTGPPVRVTDIVGLVASILCLNAFAVRWYQALLLADARAVPRRLFIAAWTRFIAYTLLFSVPTIGPAIALAVSGASLGADDPASMLAGAGAVLSIVAALATMRLSLVWPAAADGAAMGWRDAWRRMRGNTLRLAATTLLVSLPIFVTVGFALILVLTAAHVKIDPLPPHPPLGVVLLIGVADTTLQFLLAALGAAILVEFYRRLVRDAPAERSGEQ